MFLMFFFAVSPGLPNLYCFCTESGSTIVKKPSGQERNLSLVEAIFSTFPTKNESLPGKSEDTFGVEHDYEGGDVGEFDFFFCFTSEIGSRSR